MLPIQPFLTDPDVHFKVEAKRAVPRSEVSRDSGGSKVGTAVKPSASGQGTNVPNASGSGLASPSQTQIQNESRHAMDARINMDEYAYNKIFVGGLHYDTRDGTCSASESNIPEQSLYSHANLNIANIRRHS